MLVAHALPGLDRHAKLFHGPRFVIRVNKLEPAPVQRRFHGLSCDMAPLVVDENHEAVGIGDEDDLRHGLRQLTKLQLGAFTLLRIPEKKQRQQGHGCSRGQPYQPGQGGKTLPCRQYIFRGCAHHDNQFGIGVKSAVSNHPGAAVQHADGGVGALRIFGEPGEQRQARKGLSHGAFVHGAAHHQHAVFAKQRNRATVTELDFAPELIEIERLDSGHNDPGKCSSAGA